MCVWGGGWNSNSSVFLWSNLSFLQTIFYFYILLVSCSNVPALQFHLSASTFKISWILHTNNLSSYSHNNSKKMCLRQSSLPGWKFTSREMFELATTSNIYCFIYINIHTHTHTLQQLFAVEKMWVRDHSESCLVGPWIRGKPWRCTRPLQKADSRIRMQLHWNKALNVL